MPRKHRMYVPGMPCHVIQRGNNRTACFFSGQDKAFYLECLQGACEDNAVAIHAYVLMTNHVHLLLTPCTETGISQVMQSIGRRYVQHVNYTYCRSGTLWEGRHKSSLVDADGYLLMCMRYIELNPVRAQMVKHPKHYQWSSYRVNAEGMDTTLIRAHSCYQQLGSNPVERQQCYRGLFEHVLEKNALAQIRNAAEYSMPLGNDRFKQQIEATLGRALGYAKRGRPVAREKRAVGE